MTTPFRAGLNLAGALATAEHLLAQAGIEEPRREARLALEMATGLSRGRLIADMHLPLGEAALRLEAIIARRALHEPLSRIAAQRGFFGLDLTLSTATLDPRPETEHLVEAAAKALADHPMPHVVDLGTGTGAVLIALAHAMPRLTGVGVDIAGEAVETARVNAERLGMADRLTFRQGDLLDGLIGPFDGILSNPPYIPSGDIPDLMPEVRLFDPLLALDGGGDGLAFYRRIISGAAAFLAPRGFLALEIGAGQAHDVRAMLAGAGFPNIAVIPDYAGIERVLLAQR